MWKNHRRGVNCAYKPKLSKVFKFLSKILKKFNSFFYYLSGYPNGTICNYYIKRYDHKVTQFRLEFIQVQLAPPTGDGLCTRDYISVESDSLNVPRLCGNLSGQHVYVHLMKHRKFWSWRKGKLHLGINIKIAASSSFFHIRRWKIRVIQIRKHKRRFFGGLRHRKQTIYRGNEINLEIS